MTISCVRGSDYSGLCEHRLNIYERSRFPSTRPLTAKRDEIMKAPLLIITACFLTAVTQAQSVLFDFDTAPVHTSLPLSLTVSGITAHFSATGQGFSIQPANALGFTPTGFSGYCIYPNSIYVADLLVSFSTPLTDLSILYAPEEYACDSSATMRVTGYLNGVFAGTATTNAQAGTWPSETLYLHSAQGFDSVVVHYAAAPVTGGDYGPIFMADNMLVTPAPPPIILNAPMRLANGAFQFSFTNTPSRTFTVYATTNATLPFSAWIPVSGLIENPPGQYQFTDMQAVNTPRRFYRVSSP